LDERRERSIGNPMQKRKIGRREVSCIGLGAMPLSLENRPSLDDAVRVIHAAFDEGITLLDTADCYGEDDADIGHNERVVRRALDDWSGDSDAIVVATKGGLEHPGRGWSRNGRPEHLRRACERSLVALDVETIALYQLYAPDPAVPWAETVGALARLQEDGLVREIGICHVSCREIDEARAIVSIAAVQNRLNPHDLTSLSGGIVEACRERDIAFLACAPVGGLRQHETIGASSVLCEVGAAHGATPFEVAIAWALDKAPNVIPIPGATRAESVRSSVGATRIGLTDEDRRTIASVLEVPLGIH
jgi:aryl-alcohol dehydrogenase-like predicted oxidoreductase